MSRLAHPFVFAAVATLVLAAPAAAQRRHYHTLCDQNDDSDERFCEVRTIGFRPSGHALSVDASPNGAVAVSGWDRDSVDVKAAVHVRARTDEEARQIASQITVSSSDGTLHADGPSVTGHRTSWWVSFEISAPARGDLTLETVNGPLTVDGVSGNLDLHTVNGPVALNAVAGDVRARTQNGPLTVELQGSTWNGRGLDAETINGPATLLLPEGYNAQLEMGTVNGPMSFGVPVTVQGTISRSQRVHTTLGRGGPTLRVVSTNGPATIQRSR